MFLVLIIFIQKFEECLNNVCRQNYKGAVVAYQIKGGDTVVIATLFNLIAAILARIIHGLS